jgi:hypothetical protein
MGASQGFLRSDSQEFLMKLKNAVREAKRVRLVAFFLPSESLVRKPRTSSVERVSRSLSGKALANLGRRNS